MILFLCRFTKIWEQKFKKLGTKNYLQEQKFKKFGNKIYKNSRTKVTKIWEIKLQKSETKSYKNFKNMRTKI
jgi:hypothetical protein